MAWNKATLKLTYQTGTDMETGKAITKAKTYSNLREGASADACIAVAQAIESLQMYDLVGLDKVDYDKMI